MAFSYDNSKTLRRVAITGLGAVTPLGVDAPTSWQAALRGDNGIGRIRMFDADAFPCRIAGEVNEEFQPLDYVDKKDLKRMDRFVQFALAGAEMAVADAGVGFAAEESERFGCLLGVGLGGMATFERNHETLLRGGPQRVSPFFVPMLIGNMAAGHVCMRYGLRGPNSCVSTACAAGTHAIGDAFRIIQRGDADVMLTGGCESVITPLGIGGFCAMRALSTRNEEPDRASRPFDAQRDGFVLGEGAGILVLEEMERARRRGATVYAEVAGYGMSADAYHMTQPDPDARGVAICMQRALDDAGLEPQAVAYVNAHGTSTPYNDKFETLAIKRVFGDHAYGLAVSSTKSMTGHLLGAAGGVEGVFTALAVREGVVPPTRNLEQPDGDCDLDYVPNEARTMPVPAAMSNSLGFGGTNACVLFKRYVEAA